MFKWLRRKPRAYAVAVVVKRCEGVTKYRWNKVVVYREPQRHLSSTIYDVVGPFRSEIDCEQFCDRGNGEPVPYDSLRQ